MYLEVKKKVSQDKKLLIIAIIIFINPYCIVKYDKFEDGLHIVPQGIFGYTLSPSPVVIESKQKMACSVRALFRKFILSQNNWNNPRSPSELAL